MSSTHDKAAGEESLAPQDTRIMDRWSYLLAWLGGCVSIGTFAMGSSLVGTLNLLQAAVAIAIGCFVIGVALAINGAAGHKYGIPFMVQARSAFGFAGTRLPGLVRAVPAVVWYGFQSWVGAGALNAVSATLFGFDNLVFYFIAFQFLQIALSVYGFKGIKSIVKIRFTEAMPNTTWADANPREYGFYANVNPAVDHPRWSQAKERRIGEFLKRNTLPFNGYADQVASLYAGMDLRKFY